MRNILVINGPNLNLLGTREPHMYGSLTLKNIEDLCKKEANLFNINISFFQSNSEGEIINAIQDSIKDNITDIIINAASLSHTSIGILDALNAVSADIYEVHLSNIYAREKFRKHSYLSPISKGIICGFKHYGYLMAIRYIAEN